MSRVTRTSRENLVKVEVFDARPLKVLGKKKRYGRLLGKKSDCKKAIVTVAPGSSIEIFDKV